MSWWKWLLLGWLLGGGANRQRDQQGYYDPLDDADRSWHRASEEERTKVRWADDTADDGYAQWTHEKDDGAQRRDDY